MAKQRRGTPTLLVAAVLMLGPGAWLAACGDDHGHEDPDFASFSECFEHKAEEGTSAERAARECDELFEVTHTDAADCLSDHAVDVTAGVARAAIDEHCSRTFPEP